MHSSLFDSFPPISGKQEHSFAHFTIKQRLPAILDNLMRDHQTNAAILKQLNALNANILHGNIELFPEVGPDVHDWSKYITPYLGLTWYEAPFYYVEAYFYRMILEATNYFKNSNDPFLPQKQGELRGSMRKFDQWILSVEQTKKSGNRRFLDELLQLALWGNKADLSQLKWNHEAHKKKCTLIDDSQMLIDLLTSRVSRVDIVLDNSGIELLTDLLLAKWLVSLDLVEEVVLHAKAYPTFVSDATENDVVMLLNFLEKGGCGTSIDFVASLQNYLQRGNVKISSEPFWNAPLHFFEMPPMVHGELSGSDLIIFKGDANYRRVFGDRQIPMGMSAIELTAYLPAPSTSIRILKSEIMVGLGKAQITELDNKDPDWRISGKYGLIEYFD